MFRPIGLNVIIIFVIFIVCNMPRMHNDVKLEHCCLPHWYINNAIFLILRIVKTQMLIEQRTVNTCVENH